MALRPALTASRSIVASTSSSVSRRCIHTPIPRVIIAKSFSGNTTDLRSPVNLSRGRPLLSRRSFATSRRLLAGAEVTGEAAPGISITELTSSQYEDISERDMEILNESLEMLCEDLGGGEWEVEYSSGVLNLSLHPHGHYVVNKQPPNQQIWISSPISGPSRFGFSGDASGKDQGTWVHHRRQGVTLGGLLDEEIREIMVRSSISEKWEGTGLNIDPGPMDTGPFAGMIEFPFVSSSIFDDSRLHTDHSVTASFRCYFDLALAGDSGMGLDMDIFALPSLGYG